MKFITGLVTPLAGLGAQYLQNERQSDILIANAQAQSQVAQAQINANAQNSKMVMYAVLAVVALFVLTKKR